MGLALGLLYIIERNTGSVSIVAPIKTITFRGSAVGSGNTVTSATNLRIRVSFK